ncbi:hypothetical protein LENED_011438 [Lentinula edodes]|uniref:Uncharacterized protein n=1 Tax=Lentinula edodes TaxID=5353 RepID=A0A1Q3EQ19_LENED|nr:uncharacterized protein C8R40DRAFT_1165405 [Lentinula edodes]KAF8832574.1 hypothetical protein HHX47_DHR1001428 [Lentinula edodes]KAH7880445.1 hypothetical protein C8R40DRAFT_1165405 [Lentinula edodes]KAJ3919465.1 hypothetical protein F5877DRAFT_66516 [Lentinula edodes]GAW09291.1 hypothetical protein LENED_011438 [Lentinula edodes]
MSAFSRLFAFALLFISLLLAENTVNALPLDGRSPHDVASGASGPSRGGDVVQAPNSNENCANGVCGLETTPLLAILSHNGGDAGSSKSGYVSGSRATTKQCKRTDGAANDFSGASGDASGGSTTNGDGMIEMMSDNGGAGSNSASGDSNNGCS